MAGQWLQRRTPQTPFSDEAHWPQIRSPRNPFTMAEEWAELRTHHPRTLSDLPISLIAKILLHLPLTSLPTASRICKPFHQIINSPQFSRAYDQQNKHRGWIVTDNSGTTLCTDPAILFYDFLQNQWHTLLVSKMCPQETPLNPRMLSGYGGLILLTASKKDNNGQPLQE